MWVHGSLARRGVPSVSEGRGGCLTKNQPPPPPFGRVLLLSKEENLVLASTQKPESVTRNPQRVT